MLGLDGVPKWSGVKASQPIFTRTTAGVFFSCDGLQITRTTAQLVPIGLPPCLCPGSDVADDSHRIVNHTPDFYINDRSKVMLPLRFLLLYGLVFNFCAICTLFTFSYILLSSGN